MRATIVEEEKDEEDINTEYNDIYQTSVDVKLYEQ